MKLHRLAEQKTNRRKIKHAQKKTMKETCCLILLRKLRTQNPFPYQIFSHFVRLKKLKSSELQLKRQ